MEWDLKFEIEYKNWKLRNIKQYKNIRIIDKLNEGKLIITEYDGLNETKLFQFECLNGERQGKVKTYYNDGKLKSGEDYLNRKRTEAVKAYYKNGNFKSEENYLNFKKNGIVKEYYLNGKLNADKEYTNIQNEKEYNNLINELKEGKGYIKEYNAYLEDNN